MSAAKAICDHMRDWWQGTKDVRYKTISFSLDFIEYFRMNGFQWV